ncbi:hypothetical protein Skr01_05790 [Sphaerisporangium krabiense]|uniref:ABC-type phosphate transport system substrate-binding protein n=1 Tax=Sphaerisporangium krabiense TaxID=763782 RepID=A0A7W8Z7G4_9ACTN|nr:substrate-binding domain-containing protein [Sphaerisporangium krabiense]MBB5628665.1 ABC-type phosphate transport system substrate-binding protein [Sphaerisporangium krabiense]GII60494.1 hypothetical protein Skr01_05790 [Sphaerisporangium krabiense]
MGYLVGALGWLGRLVDFLGGAGPVVFGIVLLVAAPFLDRLIVRRKRLGFRVLYNSKIGIGPERLHDGADPSDSGPRQLRQVVRLLDRMSVVVIRIRNSGSYDIEPDDFQKPLSFTFGGRVVWNARISEASTPELREELRNSLRFFAAGDTRTGRDNLLTVRGRLTERMNRLLRAPSGQDAGEPRWYGVWLDGISLGRGQMAKLVVVLREPVESRADEVTKSLRHGGRLKETGLIKDEGERRRVTLPRVTGALAVVLTVVLVLSQIAQQPRQPETAVACASGELRVEGSSAFMPTMAAIAEAYKRDCPDARITTNPNGSIEGLRDLAAPATVALSDGMGEFRGQSPYAQKIAVVVFQVVVNTGVGLTTLSAEDLRKIYRGDWTDWNQVPAWRQATGGRGSLPISIVGRGGESGTRRTFERYVLGGLSEPPLTSDDCKTRRSAKAGVIRCERDENVKVVQEIKNTPGAIGYADVSVLRRIRQESGGDTVVQGLSLDGQNFDPSNPDGYPFWTVEYLYSRETPEPGSLKHGFLKYVRENAVAGVQVGNAGFFPCTAQLCDAR